MSLEKDGGIVVSVAPEYLNEHEAHLWKCYSVPTGHVRGLLRTINKLRRVLSEAYDAGYEVGAQEGRSTPILINYEDVRTNHLNKLLNPNEEVHRDKQEAPEEPA